MQAIQESHEQYFFSIKHPKLMTSITVAFGGRAYQLAYQRYGDHDIVITYDEFVAVTRGIEQATTAKERDARFREAFKHFAARQRWTPSQVLQAGLA